MTNVNCNPTVDKGELYAIIVFKVDRYLIERGEEMRAKMYKTYTRRYVLIAPLRGLV